MGEVPSLRSDPWEGAAERGIRARRTACFARPDNPRAMGRGADTVETRRLSLCGKPFFMQSVSNAGGCCMGWKGICPIKEEMTNMKKRHLTLAVLAGLLSTGGGQTSVYEGHD